MSHDNQEGSTHVIIIAVLTLALIGALGTLFWQNVLNKPKQDVAATVSQSSSPSPSSAAPAPDLIDYGSKGIEIDAKDQSNLTKLKGAPADFVAFVRKQLDDDMVTINKAQSEMPSECNRASITVQKIYKQTFAVGGFSGGCVGGADEIWARSNGTWTEAAATQDTYYQCSKLKQFKVPAALVDGKCELGDGTPDAQTYVQS